MGKVCLKCGAAAVSGLLGADSACPKCGAIFVKVEAAFSEEQKRVASQAQLTAKRASRKQKLRLFGRWARRVAYLFMTAIAWFLQVAGLIFRPFFWLLSAFGFEQSLSERKAQKSPRKASTANRAVASTFLFLPKLFVGVLKNASRKSAYQKRRDYLWRTQELPPPKSRRKR